MSGSYGTVAANSCISCHALHNASGPVRLLRGSNEADLHRLPQRRHNVSPAAPDIFAEYSKIGHPFPAGQNTHDAAEAVLLNNNRHATCADCHDATARSR